MTTKDKRQLFVIYVLLILIWEFFCGIFEVPSYILPKPSSIITYLVTHFDSLLIDTLHTFSIAVIGIIMAVIIGSVVAIIFNEFRFIKKVFMPMFNIFQTIPIIAIAPLFALWFGFGLMPKVLLVSMICAFPIIVNLVNSFDNLDPYILDYLLTLDMHKLKLYKYYYFYFSKASMYASLNIAITYSVISALFSEFMGSKYGLGLVLNRATTSSNTTLVFVVILIVVCLTLIMLKVNKMMFKGVDYEN